MMQTNKLCNRRETHRSFRSTKPELLALAIAQALALQAAQAASIEVTSSLDDGSDCTLREALATVNAGVDLLNGCVINTGVDALGTNDTISFGPTVVGQTITTTQGELSITKDVSINPGGADTTIDANQASRVMSVTGDDASDLNVTLNMLTISGGNTAGSGGGIRVLNSYSQQYVYSTVELMLTNSTVSGNTAGVGGGIIIDAGFGDYANVTLKNSTVSGNTTVGGGGGGIYVGGDFLGSQHVYLINSTVSDNTSYFGGGGINSYQGGNATLINSTVSGNTGDGIYFQISASLNLKNSTVSGNTGFGITGSEGIGMVNSIIANNNYADCIANNYYGPVEISAGSDTISTTPCGGATVADPLLGPLADNGGPTQTHALLAGSPAIDNATAAGATTSDQRGVAAEGVRDSGAYEFIAAMNALTIDKLINNEARESPAESAQLLAGSLYRQFYEVTNTSADRLYQVRVFENGNLVCNVYTLDPGETKQRCSTAQTALQGDQHSAVTVNAKVSGTSDTITANTDAFYTGISNGQGQMRVTHYINNRNADTPGQAQVLPSPQTKVLFKIENTGEIELYRTRTYHDPVSPVNSGWQEQCVIGPLKPGQVRYCKKDITLTEPGLNHAIGRARSVDAFVSPTGVISAENPTYFIVP